MFIFRTIARLTFLWMLLTAGTTAVLITGAVLLTDGFGSSALVNIPEDDNASLPDTILQPTISLNEAVERQPIFEQIPLPSQVSTDPPVVGTNFTLTAFLAILFGLISTMLNNILKNKEDRLEGWASVFYLDWLWQMFRTSGGFAVQRGCLGTPILLLIFAVYGIIFAYVQEDLNLLDSQGQQLAVVLAMAVTLVSLSGDFAQRQVARIWGKTANYGIYPMNVVVVIFTTLISRVFGIIPGILYGVPGGVDVDMENEPRFRDAILIITTVIVLLTIGAAGWGTVAWLHDVGDQELSIAALEFAGPLAALGETLGLALLVLAMETAFFEMMPVAYTMGGRLFRWNMFAWIVIFTPVTFGFLHVLLNPESKYLDAFDQIGVALLTITVVTLAIVSACIWAFLTFIEPPRRSRPMPVYPQQPPYPPYQQPYSPYQPPQNPYQSNNPPPPAPRPQTQPTQNPQPQQRPQAPTTPTQPRPQQPQSPDDFPPPPTRRSERDDRY